jgi:sugar/nucleoside kinase (ribokinase family)
MKVLCVGMMVCDIPLHTIPKNIMQLEKCNIEIPKPSAGGDALNVSMALAKLGIETALIGKIGRDVNGEFIKKCANDAGVDIIWVKYDELLNTATSYVLIDEDKERHFITSCEIFSSLTAGDISEAQIKSADIVYFGSAMGMKNMDEAGTEKLFRLAHKHNAITVMDTALENGIDKSYLLKLSKALYETDIFIPSFAEAYALTGKDDPREMKKVFKEYNLKALVIKLGSKGCYVTDFKNEQLIDGFHNVEVRDTTGAGDSFVAGFICGYSLGWDIYKCAVFANAVAALNITAIGATAGVPGFDSVIRFIENNKSESG